MPIIRVGCYERVSTDEQAKFGFSIETQVDNLTAFCANYEMKVVDHYTDEGVSGGKPAFKRPAMKRLLEDVKAGKVDMILFTKLDRWFRNVEEYFKVQAILEKHGVEWKAIHEEYDTTTANGRMAITIFLAIAQNEREKTAERIKVVFEHKRQNREACFGGARVPFGYMKEKQADGVTRLVKDPETEPIVQEFWRILVEYNNLNKAIRYMADEHGITKDVKTWLRMSQQEIFCGRYRGVENFCEPYVSPEDFEKVQNRKKIKKNPKNRTYMFRGLIRCPGCGHILCGAAKERDGKVWKSYRCRNRCKSCSYGGGLSERLLERQLLARIADDMRDEIAQVELEKAKPKPKPRVDIKKLKEKHRRLNVAYLAGNITDAEYLKADAELKAAIAKAESEDQPETTNIVPLKKMLETDFLSIYQTFNEEEKQRFWGNLLEEIYVDANKKVIGVKFFKH